MSRLWCALLLFLALPLPTRAQAPEARPQTEARAQTPEAIATEILAPLLDPAKVATLKGDRPANARLYKVLGWLESAREQGGDVSAIIDMAQAARGYSGSKGGIADKAAILWNIKKLDEYGCFTPEGVEKLKKGGSPDIMKGEHAGDQIALDHVLPRAIVPELAARFYNLEAIPARQNLEKSAKISQREQLLAQRWAKEGLLSTEGLQAVMSQMPN